MKKHTALAALGFLLGTAGISHAAQTITSAALPTGTNTAGACYIRNVGTSPISLQVEALLNFSTGFISPSFQNCNQAPLPGGRTCVLLVNDLPDDVTFECSAVVSGSVKNLRATAELRQITTSGLKVILAEDLR
jgi:hypothetical protein